VGVRRKAALVVMRFQQRRSSWLQSHARPFQGTYNRARDLVGTVFPVSEAVILPAARKAFISAAWPSCIFVASIILSLDRAPATSPLAQGLRQGRFSGAMA
jgi:hypothetical protein